MWFRIVLTWSIVVTVTWAAETFEAVSSNETASIGPARVTESLPVQVRLFLFAPLAVSACR